MWQTNGSGTGFSVQRRVYLHILQTLSSSRDGCATARWWCGDGRPHCRYTWTRQPPLSCFSSNKWLLGARPHLTLNSSAFKFTCDPDTWVWWLMSSFSQLFSWCSNLGLLCFTPSIFFEPTVQVPPGLVIGLSLRFKIWVISPWTSYSFKILFLNVNFHF